MAKIPAAKYTNWHSYIKRIFPGLGLCIILGIVARLIDTNIVPAQLFIFNYAVIGILLGIFVKNVFKLPAKYHDGIEFSTKICLYTGIVLLGAGLNLQKIFAIGGTAVLMVAVSITFSIAFCGWIAKKTGAGERLGHLVGTGIGVCGVSAIIAIAPAIKAKEKEIVTAIGAALLPDVIVLISLPLIGHALGWSDNLAGFMAGVVPSNTAQCIAIGYAYSEPAGMIATVVKSARNALMPVAILVMTYIYTLRGLPVDERLGIGLLWNKFPKFVVGFLIAATLNSIGLIPAQSAPVIKDISTWFFVVSFVGIGAFIDFKGLGKRDITVIGFGFIMTLILWSYTYFFSTVVLSF